MLFVGKSFVRRLRSEAGYSLIEAMIVVALVGILGLVGPRLMVKLQEFYLLTTARNDIQRDARAALDNINRFLRQAQYSSIIIDSPSSQGPYSRIRFSHIDGRSFEFRQSGKNLIQKVGTNESIIAKNLAYIAFTFPRSDYPRLVSVSMTMSKDTYKGGKKELELTIQKIRVMN